MSTCQGCIPVRHSMSQALKVYRYSGRCHEIIASLRRRNTRVVQYRYMEAWMQWVVGVLKVRELRGRNVYVLRARFFVVWRRWAAVASRLKAYAAWQSRSVCVPRAQGVPPPPSRSTSYPSTCASTSPPPSRSSTESSFALYRDRLYSFYSHYNPSKLPSVGATLRLYASQEEDMMLRLIEAYGPEPPSVFQYPLLPGWTEYESDLGDLWYTSKDGTKRWMRPIDVTCTDTQYY
eukprot:TRINITY_DN31519_c0_g1_i1.p1 TRINITY_DN31519_c0_g1~~TRINITY_DN31519_c0_g1_i1.p1  ORF type:complete len:234 (+),score=36.82 TRINITY_DN31519_c0_g1_i1:37-738(+)